MDYEKKYKEALNRAKDVHTYYCDDSAQLRKIESIFPELAESKDEKIRKELIDFIYDKTDTYELREKSNSWLAWIEKQGEQTNLPQFTFDDVLALQCCMETVKKVQEDKELYEALSILHNKVYDAYHLEKQGEQKVNYTTLVETGNGGINALVTRELPTNSCDDANYCSDCIKKKGCINCEDGNMKETLEQKPADNTEQKFHEGEWVIYKNDICQIVKREEGCNKLVTVFGIEKELVNERNLSTARLWSIDDSKDGDVLVDKSDGTIGIFQSIGHHPDGGSYNDPSYCFLHCRYDDGYFYAGFENGNTMDSDDAIPATKEQRDALFAKMKEAGYEWDKEKKELKNIEKQASKPKWSDEDEHRLKDTIYFLDTAKKHYASTVEIDACINWLKSLKKRIGE